MAAAQEFSSPGAHMASLANNSQGYTVGKPPTSNVIYAGTNASPKFGTYREAQNNSRFEYYDDGTFGFSRKSLDDYIQPYLKYNEDLFTRAQDYDKMMSDTSIRRQMEDLKAAGINPILAGRLGGAQYKGVSAPYVTINPAGMLSAMATFQGNQMNYNARMSEIASREHISENELKNRMEIAEKQIAADLERAGLDRENLLKIAYANNFTQKEIAEMNNEAKIQVQELYNSVVKQMNDDNINNAASMNTNSNITHIIQSGLTALGVGIAAKINATRRGTFYGSFPGIVGMDQYYNAGLFNRSNLGGYQ